MTDFLAKSACSGRKPVRFDGVRQYSRADLITAMMKERSVVRFLVAPPCFGKTTLILEYAQSIFSFENMFWVNAQSPCFLRDLDSGIIVPELLMKSSKPALVVFEDLPYLDRNRAQVFSTIIDSLLENAWEVVVSTTPLNDVYGESHSDRICLLAHDFLLSDSEIRYVLTDAELARKPLSDYSHTQRIPGLFWLEPHSEKEPLRKIIRDEIPSDLLLCIFSFLVLGNGHLQDIEEIVGIEDAKVIKLLEESYLYLGIDRFSGEFVTYPFSIGAIAEIFSKYLGRMVTSSKFLTKDLLISHLAELLLSYQDTERACLCVSTLSSVAQRMAWLEEKAPVLFRKGCFLAAHEVFETLHIAHDRQGSALLAAEAWRLFFLNNVAESLRVAIRVSQMSYADESTRALAALLLARHGNETARSHARDLLCKITGYVKSESKESAGNTLDSQGLARFNSQNLIRFEALDKRTKLEERVGSEERASTKGLAERTGIAPTKGLAERTGIATAKGSTGGPIGCSKESWLILSLGYLSLSQAPLSGFQFVTTCYHEQVGTEVLSLLLAWLLQDLYSFDSSASINSQERLLYEDIVREVCVYLEPYGVEKKIDYSQVLLYESLEKAIHRYLPHFTGDFSPALLSFVRREETSVFCQRTSFERDRKERDLQHKDYAQTHPRGFSSGFLSENDKNNEVTPLLHVQLFGGLEVTIGDRMVNPHLLRRQKVRTLLALLVLNQGKEVSCEKLAKTLWPNSISDKATRNFYSVWSMLRTALKTPSGTCPYLVRLQYSCKIDGRLVSSDVRELDELCRKLLFGAPDMDSWSQVYNRISQIYTDDLLPCENENEFIIQARNEYRSRLVDAFVAASDHLLEKGEKQASLWFARSAVTHDKTREDAYTALMQSQIAVGQRSAALETFFACKNYLVEELGIDPSSKTVELYSAIIEEDSSLVNLEARRRRLQV